jgi:hypothetical protein
MESLVIAKIMGIAIFTIKRIETNKALVFSAAAEKKPVFFAYTVICHRT